jgi:CarD family transcriptional regulator
MFEVGDYIVCGSNGICEVQNVSTIDIPDVDPERLYYILQPVYKKSSVVYIPVDRY